MHTDTDVRPVTVGHRPRRGDAEPRASTPQDRHASNVDRCLTKYVLTGALHLLADKAPGKERDDHRRKKVAESRYQS